MDWLQAVKDVGFPIVAYGAFAYAVWSTLRWVADNVILPSQRRAFQFIDRLEKNIATIDETIKQQARLVDAINMSHAGLAGQMRDSNEMLRQILVEAKANTDAINGCSNRGFAQWQQMNQTKPPDLPETRK